MTKTQTAFLSTSDGEWFVGNDAARGPWSPDHCHAGPVAGVFARAFEALIPEQSLVRLSAVFGRPVPIAGFRVTATICRIGRTVSTATAELKDRAGAVCATAGALHMTVREVGDLPSAAVESPDFSEATPGAYPIVESQHGRPWFAHAVDVAYPPGETIDPGPTTVWMRTPPLLANEQPSPFQRLCPLADCGNATSRNAGLAEVAFVNPDLTIVCFRPPESEWLASKAVSFWEPTGIGLANAMLFDKQGPVGTALQTLILNRV